MTREEAIERLKTMRWEHATNPCPDRTALDMAIKTLQQEPYKDCVSKQAVLDLLVKHDNEMKSDVFNEIFDNIDKLPSVNPDKTGHWIDDGQYAEGHSEHVYRCSECNKIYIGYIGKYRECPNCRAKMYELTGSED